MIVAFTGHRPDKLGGYDADNPVAKAVKQALRAKLRKLAPAKAITGMALGVDQLAAEVCIEMNIPFIAAIPFKGQECKWPKRAQEHYNYLLTFAHEAIIVCEGEYSPRKMQIRNEWMVDRCQRLIAVYDGSTGGTANCVDYAERKGRRISVIDPTPFFPKPVRYERPGYL